MAARKTRKDAQPAKAEEVAPVVEETGVAGLSEPKSYPEIQEALREGNPILGGEEAAPTDQEQDELAARQVEEAGFGKVEAAIEAADGEVQEEGRSEDLTPPVEAEKPAAPEKEKPLWATVKVWVEKRMVIAFAQAGAAGLDEKELLELKRTIRKTPATEINKIGVEVNKAIEEAGREPQEEEVVAEVAARLRGATQQDS